MRLAEVEAEAAEVVGDLPIRPVQSKPVHVEIRAAEAVLRKATAEPS